MKWNEVSTKYKPWNLELFSERAYRDDDDDVVSNYIEVWSATLIALGISNKCIRVTFNHFMRQNFWAMYFFDDNAFFCFGNWLLWMPHLANLLLLLGNCFVKQFSRILICHRCAKSSVFCFFWHRIWRAVSPISVRQKKFRLFYLSIYFLIYAKWFRYHSSIPIIML